MRNVKIIIGFLFLFLMLGACNKLDTKPLVQIPDNSFFKKTSNLELYMNQFYSPTNRLLDYGGSGGLNYSMLIFFSDLGTDNFIGSSIDPLLNGQNTVPSSGGGWDYSLVRSVNYFLEHYQECEDPFDTYKQYVGEAYFFKAMIYYKLVKQFGDVLWYDKVLQTDSKELFDARTARNIVIDRILTALDTAALYMTPERNDDGLRLNKWTALTLQTRVALYEGTWEKYHANDPFGVSGANPDKYFNKVVEAATAIINSGNFEIYSNGHPTTDYYNFFNLPDYASNKEVILWKKFDKSLDIKNYRSIVGEIPVGQGITKSLADAYLCTDGKSISSSSFFKGYNSIYDEMKNRDPRFYQTIFTPDAPYEIQGVDTLSFWKEKVYNILFTSSEYSTPTGYVIRKGYNADLSVQDKAGNNEPIILFRYAEVLLNLSEAKAELGTITQADLDQTIKPLRDRVGMPNIILSSIPNDPNWQFSTLSPILNEIRRERRIELALEGFRLDDILRWGAADDLIVGKRPKGIAYGEQFPNNPYSDDVNGFMDPYQSALPNGYGFKIDRDYLHPLPQKELTLNPQLVQNHGWK